MSFFLDKIIFHHWKKISMRSYKVCEGISFITQYNPGVPQGYWTCFIVKVINSCRRVHDLWVCDIIHRFMAGLVNQVTKEFNSLPCSGINLSTALKSKTPCSLVIDLVGLSLQLHWTIQFFGGEFLLLIV